jgi:hypothetical protein
MAPRNRDPTNAQISSRLRYDQGTAPAFLARMRAQVAGHAIRDEDEDEPSYDYDGNKRPPIPTRPSIPTRPGGGSDDEEEKRRKDGTGELDEDDGDDEAPQVVVLREGKHLNAWEAENERRKGGSSCCDLAKSILNRLIDLAKGLSPLPDPATITSISSEADSSQAKQKKAGTGAESAVSMGAAKKSTKRKIVGDAELEPTTSKPEKKKSKKEKKSLLSFGDDA